jgi:hypothetical protein
MLFSSRTQTVALFVAAAMATGPAAAQSCAIEPLCTEMTDCAEADYYFRKCGHAKRDADGDGIPCESLCGATMEIYVERRASGGQSFGVLGEAFSCDGKRTCGEMISCAEARFYLNQCGATSLDGDDDGTPCNALCR